MATTTAARDQVIGHRQALAAFLADLSDDQWSSPSLCEGWQVRHVAGHLLLPVDVPAPTFIWAIVRNRGYDEASRRLSIDLGERPRDQLLTTMRDKAATINTPPGMPVEAAVFDAVVHTADMLIPLALRMDIPAATYRTAFEFLMSKKGRRYRPSGGLDGLRFEATEIDWSTGDGPLVTGDAQHLIAAMCGRPGPVDALTGDGVSEFLTRF